MKKPEPKTTNARRGAGAAGRKGADNEETLLAKIKDLEDQLQLRDEEYSQQRNELDKIKDQNDFLKKEYMNMRLAK